MSAELQAVGPSLLSDSHNSFSDAASQQMERLVEDFGRMYRERNEALEEVARAHHDALLRLAMAAELKDDDTGVHIVRIGFLAEALALLVGQSKASARMLRKAAPMHDIGKIGIPDAVLLKKGALTPEEWAVMRTHAQIGADILGTHPPGLMQVASEVAITHHEKWDGSGYPHGLAGTAIPISGRIAAIADVFDALTSERPYKAAWTVEAAMGLLRAQSGKHFDPALVTLFEANLPEILAVKERWAETTPPMPYLPPTA